MTPPPRREPKRKRPSPEDRAPCLPASEAVHPDESSQWICARGTAARIGKPFEEPEPERDRACSQVVPRFRFEQRFRRVVIKIIKHPWFDRFITFLIRQLRVPHIDSPVLVLSLVESTAFDMFIMIAIVLNTCVLAMTITPDDGRAVVLEIINFYVFAMLFAIEMI